jgi:hypothetical protein
MGATHIGTLTPYPRVQETKQSKQRQNERKDVHMSYKCVFDFEHTHSDVLVAYTKLPLQIKS